MVDGEKNRAPASSWSPIQFLIYYISGGYPEPSFMSCFLKPETIFRWFVYGFKYASPYPNRNLFRLWDDRNNRQKIQLMRNSGKNWYYFVHMLKYLERNSITYATWRSVSMSNSLYCRFHYVTFVRYDVKFLTATIFTKAGIPTHARTHIYL